MQTARSSRFDSDIRRSRKTRSLTRCVALLTFVTLGVAGPAFAPSSAQAAVLYQSATLGPTGQSGGVSLSSTQWLGVKFPVASDFLVTEVRGHIFDILPGDLFAAIVPLADMASLPATNDLSDAVWSTTFAGPSPSDEIIIPTGGLVLPAGTYGLVFGTALFGATGAGAMPSNNPDIGAPAYFRWAGSSWVNGGFNNVYFRLDGLDGTVDNDGDGWTMVAGDCDDLNPFINPSAAEACDGLDNDCNPATADGSDEPWIGIACDGPDTDFCDEGTLECIGATPACTDVSPDNLDVCDGFDNDCNPATVDGADEPLLGAPCDGADSDLCEEGPWVCAPLLGGMICADGSGDNLDLCDGLDNDCDPTTTDGAAEPTLGNACDGPDADLCDEGVIACAGGALGCSDTSGNNFEACDGSDNDCNPATTDGTDETWLGTPCDGPDTDLCTEGVFSCVGAFPACDDITSDDLELCDNFDNDCNAATADGFDELLLGDACDGADTDLCDEGTLSCDSALSALVCSDATGDDVDTCDGLDNDCDSTTLDGSAEATFGTACDGSDSDLCNEGFIGCAGGTMICGDATGDDVEICDGLDNDCNGLPDDGTPDTDGDGIADMCESDVDADGIPDDGDGSGVAGDSPCTGGATANCDDNCPLTQNAPQLDTDGDGVGDACSIDSDGDGVLDGADNCPLVANIGQQDNDGDGDGDACDIDDDDDGIVDTSDNCPFVVSADQTDTDSDGLGDPCDPDDDADGVLDGDDNCPLTASIDLGDIDGDGLGNPCDDDDDGDTVLDAVDNCPAVANPLQEDANGNGVGDACEVISDMDGDGVTDSIDNCPADPNPAQIDTDGDGDGDECDADDDGDSVDDVVDNCPLAANADQDDADADGVGDVCDDDRDGDSVENSVDNCPDDANMDQDDEDGDGEGDECDADDDGDGIEDDVDNCPGLASADTSDPDGDGDGNPCDDDDDGDGVDDSDDNCPLVANEAQVDTDGDGAGEECDADDDDDGVDDAVDNCPLIANGDQADDDGDGVGDACSAVVVDVEFQGSGCGCRIVAGSAPESDDGAGRVPGGLGGLCVLMLGWVALRRWRRS